MRESFVVGELERRRAAPRAALPARRAGVSTCSADSSCRSCGRRESGKFSTRAPPPRPPAARAWPAAGRSRGCAPASASMRRPRRGQDRSGPPASRPARTLPARRPRRRPASAGCAARARRRGGRGGHTVRQARADPRGPCAPATPDRRGARPATTLPTAENCEKNPHMYLRSHGP